MSITNDKWTGASLKCAREALGLSLSALADWLPWKQSRLSEAERGMREVPDFVQERVRELERARDELLDAMIDALEASGDNGFLIVHEYDVGYRKAHAGEDVPATVQRVAAGLAASYWEAEHGVRPTIAFRDEVR